MRSSENLQFNGARNGAVFSMPDFLPGEQRILSAAVTRQCLPNIIVEDAWMPSPPAEPEIFER
jgi:hypothetical protein